MAAIRINSSDTIQFTNVRGKENPADPTLLVQAGDWAVGDHVEAGVVFDTMGESAPLLTAANARKLSRWLLKAADWLDGIKPTKKKSFRHDRDQDEETDMF